MSSREEERRLNGASHLGLDERFLRDLPITPLALRWLFQNVIRHAWIGGGNAVENDRMESVRLHRCNARTTRSAARLGRELRTRPARQPAVLVLGRRGRQTLESDSSIRCKH